MSNPGYRIDLEEDLHADGRPWWMASHPELPGCMAQGDTPEEAVAALDEARELYLTVCRRQGLAFARPTAERFFRGKINAQARAD